MTNVIVIKVTGDNHKKLVNYNHIEGIPIKNYALERCSEPNVLCPIKENCIGDNAK